MFEIEGFPKNREKFVRLIGFFKIVLDMCSDLDIRPILDGSLAVFAYTKSQEMTVNDVDLSCPEDNFSRIIEVLEKKGLDYKLQEWHVLQILQGDLKIELGSAEYWLANLPIKLETLQIDEYRVEMLDLHSLQEFYRQGMEDRSTQEGQRIKYEALKQTYELLKSATRSGRPN